MNDGAIEKYRKRKKLSQQRLAAEVGVSQATISRLEQGDHADLDLRLAAKIARALEVDLREISPDAVADVQPDDFFAYCAEPFCDSNELKRDGAGKPTVYYRSGELYPTRQWDDINFCAQCGHELVKECAECHMRFKHLSNFCTRCGTQASARPTAEEWKRIGEILDEKDRLDDDIPF